MDITRFPGNAVGRSRSVTFDNLVFTVATAAGSPSLQEQTRQVLARIEQNLADAGSDKTRLLSATVYLADIAKKAEMDEVWNEWIGPENWPQRACVQLELSPGVLVEITASAPGGRFSALERRPRRAAICFPKRKVAIVPAGRPPSKPGGS
jgi:enamine deaminase RidA (YjgF/YER057c/UK114 family)